MWWGQQRWQVSQYLALLTIMICSNPTFSCCSGAGKVVQITGRSADTLTQHRCDCNVSAVCCSTADQALCSQSKRHSLPAPVVVGTVLAQRLKGIRLDIVDPPHFTAALSGTKRQGQAGSMRHSTGKP